MMLAKFSGWPISTQVPVVNSPVNTIGAMVIATSRMRFRENRSRPVIATKDSAPAWINASTTARPPACRLIAVPVTSGAILIPEAMNRLSTALSLESPFGEMETRALPSGACHCRTICGGRVSMLTGRGCSKSRI
jgi:hypothetical protein